MASMKTTVMECVRRTSGLTDREITDSILGVGEPQQHVNQVCRALATQKILQRRTRPDGKIGNYMGDIILPDPPVYEKPVSSSGLSEDEVKLHLCAWLKDQGYSTQCAMQKERGIDIDAHKGNQRWIIEVKGCGSLPPMRVNYFLCVLGETLQRMSDPDAQYSIAFPDMPQFRRLWERLPSLAKKRTGITALFVSESAAVIHE